MVLDEIYDLSIYDEDPDQKFQSATELFTTPEARQKLIWLWGLSKVSRNFLVIFAIILA